MGEPPDEHVQRFGTEQATDDPWCQVNVRLRRSMKLRVDERREKLGLSRDDWVRHVIEWALLQPPMTPVRRRNGRRT